MDHTRHIGIFDASQKTVTLIGAGGIGAITAVVLAKMGVSELIIYDDDMVEDVNLPTQFYPISALHSDKVDAACKLVYQFSDETYPGHVLGRYGADRMAHTDIVISAVDSIASRKAIWAGLKDDCSWDWYIDARMGAETFQASIVSGEDSGWYHRNLALQDDSRIPDLPCTSKATIYTGALAAGHIGWIVRRIVTGEPLPKKIVHDLNAISLMAL